ncbi:MAG: glutamyl-tRNA reductase [Sporolactobacillus sp.]
MHILAVGVDFQHAPVEVRERVTFDPSELEQALTELRESKSIYEDVIVSTCNRTELFVVSDQLHTGKFYTKRFFADWFHIDQQVLNRYLSIKEDEEAIHHLFRVACGLESMVLGETQILGQVRKGFLLAQSLNTTGTFFNELFKEAITLAKQAHDQTQINDHPVSVSYAAIELIHSTVGSLTQKSVLILGSGEMSQLAVHYLQKPEVGQLTIANRTLAHAQELAASCQADFLSLEAAKRQLNTFDVVIAATSAKHYVLQSDDLHQAALTHPLVLMDLGLPRNIDPQAAGLEAVTLFDLDHLNARIDSNRKARLEAAEQIELLVQSQQHKYQQWLHTLGVVPVIAALRQKAVAIQEETMRSMTNKLPELTEQERKIISKHAKSMMNQMMRDPIAKIKELACGDHGTHAVDLFAEIFNLSDRVNREENDHGSDEAKQARALIKLH